MTDSPPVRPRRCEAPPSSKDLKTVSGIAKQVAAEMLRNRGTPEDQK